MIDQILLSPGIADLAFRYLGELSGGQRQLAFITQTLARESKILLMDEPTSARLCAHIGKRKGMIVFIAMHDLNQALRFADHMLVLGNDTVLASCPKRNVITMGILREVIRVDARTENCSRRLDRPFGLDVIYRAVLHGAGRLPYKSTLHRFALALPQSDIALDILRMCWPEPQ